MPSRKREVESASDDGRSQRYIVRFKPEKPSASIKTLESKEVGLKVARSSDFKETELSLDSLGEGETIFLEKLGIAIIQAPEDQINALSVADEGSVQMRPEREFFIFGNGVEDRPRSSFDLAAEAGFEEMPESSVNGDDFNISANFIRGYYAGVSNLMNELVATTPQQRNNSFGIAAQLNQSKATWGLQVTNALTSSFTGKGIRVAVLDTGLDLTHPDFVGRNITSKSFLTGVPTAQDGNGHGTHCAGTICGLAKPSKLPRYGVAPEAELFVGKVLRDNGSGPESAILMGIEWAIVNNCRIISMSLGRRVSVNEPPDDDYEEIGRTALDNNCLIIAAAGNESQRPGSIAPVGAPANSTNIMAVAALQRVNNGQFAVARFSNGGLNPGGGKVDIAGPGVAIYSSWSKTAYGPSPLEPNRPPTGTAYHTISGTSMATPHVAGIAALLAQQTPAPTAHQIMHQLTQTALPIGQLLARDVGSGLVQAPQAS